MILAQENTNFLIENGIFSKQNILHFVMLISIDKLLKLKDGKLANIAPTILDYMGIKKPKSMVEESLIK